MVSALDSGSSGLGSSPGWGHPIVFLGRTHYSYSTPLRLGDSYAVNLMLGGGNSALD